MKIKQTLGTILLVGTLALVSAGCRTDHSQYKYNEKIGGDQIKFVEKKYCPLLPLYDDDNILTEVKEDGRAIRYEDTTGDDLKLEYVWIAKDGQTTKYTTRDKIVLEKAQENFDARMKQILEINTNKKSKIKEDRINQGLENLK